MAALVILALAILSAGASSAEAAEFPVRQLAREALATCDESLPNMGSPTFSDGVVQRREMTIRLPTGPDEATGVEEEVVHDWRRFYAKIDGRGGKRDRKGQLSEILRWTRRFDLNHNGRLSRRESKRISNVLWGPELRGHLVRIYRRPVPS
jgi:hypothetical protein